MSDPSFDYLMNRPDNRTELAAIGREVKTGMATIGGFLAIFWILELIDIYFLGQSLNAYGIVPRAVSSLPGILAAPFLHGGLGHLIANTVPFAMFGGLIMLQSQRRFWAVTVIATLVGGLGTWLVGAAGVHIGASGVIFGYFGYLLSQGLFERKIGSILMSLMVMFFWGGLVFGVLPGTPGISWEGHLFGMLGGVFSGFLMTRKHRAKYLLTE